MGLVALGVFTLSMVLAIVGLGNSVAEIRKVEVAQSPTTLLANAGVKEDTVVKLPVMYYDQISDVCVDLYDETVRDELYERQWEWNTCGYHGDGRETGIAAAELDANGLPVATGEGRLVPNRGVNFDGWFSEMEGISSQVPGALLMRYVRDGAEFKFKASDFYPLDDIPFSEGDPANTGGHNRLFTMSFAVPFTVLGSGRETFSIRADDDTLVFLDGKLVIDMGGIHGATTGEMIVDRDGRVYARIENGEWADTGVAVTAGTAATIAVFHADRNSDESVLELDFMGMNLALAGGTQIATVTGANAAGGSLNFTAPLGETKVFEADKARMLTVVATIEGVAVVVAAVLVVTVARFMIKQKVMK